MFLVKYSKILAGFSWALNFLALFYFGYISWWASVNFNGFTSMIFGIPILLTLLISAYLAGKASEKTLNAGRLSKKLSQFICIGFGLYYLTGFFPSLEVVSEAPVKVVTKLSKMITGKTPEKWTNQ